jgi:hypothetical protein
MIMHPRSIRATRTVVGVTFMLLLVGCGGGTGSDTASKAPGAGNGAAPTAASGGSGAGPDTSGLADYILAKINADPTRQEMKVTGKMLEFNIVSSATESHGNMGASSVVECAGVAVFDGDVAWSWQDTTPKKAGEPAKFECRVEYANQGQGWEIFGPVGIYPL